MTCTIAEPFIDVKDEACVEELVEDRLGLIVRDHDDEGVSHVRDA